MEDKRHSAGLRLLSCLLLEKDWNLLEDNGFLDSDFYGDSQQCLKFIREYYEKYDDFPDQEVISEEIGTDFPSKVATEFAVKSLAKQLLARKLSAVSAKSQQFLVNNKPDEAFSYMLESLLKITPVSKAVSFKANANKRVLEYKKKKLTGLLGIVPPWPTLRDAIAVWEQGTFNVVLGVYSTGKTWMCAVAALHAAFNQGKKVILVTMENSKSSIESRLDALYHHIPFTDLRQGWVDTRVEKRWQNDISKLVNEEGDIIVADGNMVRSVADVMQLVNTHKPDFVVVDGAYKLEATGRDLFERSSNLLHSFHHAAEVTLIPWLASSQLNPSADKMKGGKDTASEARGNKDWVINPATVFTLTQSNDQRLLNLVECRIAKAREIGDVANLEMMFLVKQDRQRMLFDEAVDEFVNTEILESLL